MNLPPIHRQVIVPVLPEAAFAAFTGKIAAWWPVERFSVYGAGSSPAFRDSSLVETGPDGAESVWGTVLDWAPPRSFRMTWHPGRDAAQASVVEVSFAPVGDSATLVTVTHSGWESLEARNEYRQGWPAVLADYAATVGEIGPEDGEVVLVLRHTPAPGVANPFTEPGFAEHRRFLEGLRERGVLVGAGPFPGTGEGMTIVRVGGTGEAAAIVHAAHYEDGAVTGGVLEVSVRSWGVMLHGSSLA
jgi:uncharacterized protein YciI